jgi:hypothetical protein
MLRPLRCERAFAICLNCRVLKLVLVPLLISGCAHLVKISYPPEAVIHPRFDQSFTTWEGERLQVRWTHSLRKEAVLESAAQLRQNLQETQRLFDPAGNAVASRHVVVVAHSMGGLLAHTLVSDSDNSLWNVFANKPLNTLSLTAAERSTILQYFFFRHQACIDRVIFLAVSHRGSWLAAGIVGSIGSRMIQHPRIPGGVMKQLASEYPGILSPYFAKVSARGGPTSLFSLAPNPLLDSIAALPIRVPFHSIIGNRGIEDGPESSDGVVSYRSSHLEGAESEKIVPAGHNLLSNEATITEIKRILDLDKNLRGRERCRLFRVLSIAGGI